MKTIFTYTLLFFQISLFAQTWVQKASLPIIDGIQGCFSFSINGKLYVGGGYDYNLGNVVNGFYEYDPVTNAWTVKASVPVAVGTNDGFVLNGMGYIACGTISGNIPSNYVYRYDPSTNTWTAMNNFLGSSRQNHICFSLNGYGYMFGGFDGVGTLNEMWEYNPTTDSWVQKASPPLPLAGPGRNGPAELVINNQAYVGLGGTANGSTTFSDFYLFNPGSIGLVGSGTYTSVASIPVGREAAANFTIGSLGYIGIGYQGGTGSLNDFWIYDPVANTWTADNNFNGGARQHPFSAAVDGEPYVGCGDNAIGGKIDNWTWAFCTQGSLGNDTTLCNTAIFTLRDTFTNATRIWSTGDTTSSIMVSTSGRYWVQVMQGTCINRDTINITFANNLPSFNIGNDTTYCGAFYRTLSTGVSGTHWSTGVSTSSITVSTPGLYWAQESNICGSLRDSIIISDNPLPLVDLGNDTSVCPGNEIILNAGNPGATYLWQNNMTSQTLTVSSAGIYWVNVTVNGCSKQDSINVSSLSPPLPFSIGIDTTICEDSSLVLNAFQNNTKYFWSNGDTTAIITVNQSGKYFVIDSNSCGSYSASISVTTKPCVCRVAIPTAFSPNNDGRNDFFWVLTQCPLQNFQFDIYNRWGQKIFSTNNVTDKWDGTYRGMQQPLGVYVYFLKYRDPYTDKDISQTGDVTLLR